VLHQSTTRGRGTGEVSLAKVSQTHTHPAISNPRAPKTAAKPPGTTETLKLESLSDVASSSVRKRLQHPHSTGIES
jgi:hypothetical protein